MGTENYLKQFVKNLVDKFPVGDAVALKIYNFYKEWLSNNKDKVIIIETHHLDTVEWGISFNGSNPTNEFYFKCKDKEEAKRLVDLIN